MVRLNSLDTAGLGNALGDIVRLGEGSEVMGCVCTLLRTLVPADDITLVVFRPDQPPELLHDTSSGPASDDNLSLYLKGAWLLDPFYRAFAEGMRGGCWRLKQLTPAAFRSSEYYRQHYVRTGFSDEIGYLVPLEELASVHVSIGARATGFRYREAHREQLAAFLPLLEQVLARYWRSRDAVPVHTLTTQLDSALSCFGHDFLTDRESEVIQLLLRGHSTASIAQRLGISPETVKLHRKHSYAKLDVRSQAELFHLFIDSLGSVGTYRGGDPLRGYLDR